MGKQDDSVCNRYRNDLVEVGRRLYDKGLLVGSDGNLSVRIGDDEILISPSGVCKGFINPSEIPKVNLKGEIIAGTKKPARDIRMHLAVYRCRPDVKAIVHAHPPVATGFAIARLPIKITLPEVVFGLGNIVMTDYATPTTEQVPRVVEKALAKEPTCGALLLANHGALTVGNDLMDAYYKMESLEMFLKATLVAKLLGNESGLTDAQMAELRALTAGEKISPSPDLRKEKQIKNIAAQIVEGIKGEKIKEEIDESMVIRVVQEVMNELKE